MRYIGTFSLSFAEIVKEQTLWRSLLTIYVDLVL
jgi:hypothetical protein